MRRIIMMRYIHQLDIWPKFVWDHEKIAALLGLVRNRQGRLMGRMEVMGFALRSEAMLQTLTLDVIKSSEIEGEVLDAHPRPALRLASKSFSNRI